MLQVYVRARTPTNLDSSALRRRDSAQIFVPCAADIFTRVGRNVDASGDVQSANDILTAKDVYFVERQFTNAQTML
jgi:hypothetical protein